MDISDYRERFDAARRRSVDSHDPEYQHSDRHNAGRHIANDRYDPEHTAYYADQVKHQRLIEVMRNVSVASVAYAHRNNESDPCYVRYDRRYFVIVVLQVASLSSQALLSDIRNRLPIAG